MLDVDPAAALARELGVAVSDQVAQLHPADLEHLNGLIVDARRRQVAEIAAAADRGLSFVPRLLRAPLRKALG